MRHEYPFETHHLQKGDRIPARTVAYAYSVEVGTNEFRLSLLRAKEVLERSFLERGVTVTVVEDHEDLVVLDDPDAARYNARSQRRAVRKFARAHSRNLGVDRARLEEPELVTHDRNLEVGGRTLQAISREMSLRPGPRPRQTPGLPEPRSEDSDA